jgi:hypothetical protein
LKPSGKDRVQVELDVEGGWFWTIEVVESARREDVVRRRFERMAVVLDADDMVLGSCLWTVFPEICVDVKICIRDVKR